MNRFRSWRRNSSSLTSSITMGVSGVAVTATGALAATKASTWEPRWKCRMISQLASGETKRFMLKASSRCSSMECDQRLGRKILSSWMRIIDTRASGRTSGRKNWRELLLQSRSQAALTSSGRGVLWSR
ncbi:hypothetical protein D3C71_1743960 [compost metagenome]